MRVLLLVGCLGAPDLIVDGHTRGTAATCVPAVIEDVQHTGVSSPSVSGINTRARVRTEDGREVRWDYMRGLHKASRLVPGDTVVLLLGAEGTPTGMARTCPEGLSGAVP